MSFGLVVSPGFLPDRAELDALRPSFLRSIIYHVSDVDRLGALGLPFIVTVNNECAEVGGDWSGWDTTIEAIVDRPGALPWAVACGNEFDIWGNPSPEFAADLIHRAAPILHDWGIHVIGTSVASATWPQWLARLADGCRDAVDWFDVHPYGQRPSGWGSPGWGFGDLATILRSASAIAGRPIACTEYGVKIDDAGGPGQVAAFLTAAEQTVRALPTSVVGPVAWFAWRDQIGAPHERGGQAFGLLSETGARRPAWYAYAALPKEDVVDPESVWPGAPAPGAQFVLGFADWAQAEPELIGAPHDAREFGAAHGISQQRTTRGLLSWCDLRSGQVMTFLDATNGRRYRWIGGGSQEVA